MSMDTNYNFSPKRTKRIRIFPLMLLCSFISLVVGAGGVLLLFHFYPELTQHNVTNTNITKTEKEVTVNENGIADAVDKIYDSVVIVKTYNNNKLYATGTGFVYKEVDGTYYIITNYHVIEKGDKISVVFTNGEESVVGVKNGDKYADIAVLSYKGSENVVVSEIGSSVDTRVGDTVFAIGAPLNSDVYSWTVTRGVLSGKDREVEVSMDNSQVSDWIMQVLQTDAAINSGNSGGPLCNSNGQVIGVTNMKLATTGVEGMGFAIPIEEAALYADTIISGKEYVRPYIGVSMIDATNAYYARKYNVEIRDGVLIGGVEANSPASKAGLKEGDIIISIADTNVKNVASLRYQLYKGKVGDSVTIKYIREGKEQSTSLTLASKN